MNHYNILKFLDKNNINKNIYIKKRTGIFWVVRNDYRSLEYDMNPENRIFWNILNYPFTSYKYFISSTVSSIKQEKSYLVRSRYNLRSFKSLSKVL